MDEKVMKNTYDEYKRLGTVNIDSQGNFNDYNILDSCIFVTDDGMQLNKNTGLNNGHWDTGFTGYVIAKGWAWELVYNKEILNDKNRIDELVNFQLDHITPAHLYNEFWWWNDYRDANNKHRYSDPGNQEHSSWQAYAIARVYPTMRKSYGIHLEEYNALMDKIAGLDKTQYTDESLANLQAVVSDSEVVLKEADLLQAEVNIQVEKVDAMYKALAKKPVDKAQLLEKINEAKGLNQAEYTSASWKGLKAALTEAEAMYNKADASQSELATALEGLEAAITALKKISKEELGALITVAEGLKQAEYTETSWKALEVALQAARIVFEKATPTEQQLETAITELQAAISGLKKVKAPASDGTEKKPSAASVSTGDISNPAFWAVLVLGSGSYMLLKRRKREVQ